ncbi:hypothetical protein AGOR_G00038070 [Albula goreensis]|uniref:NXPE C-terminal domain-containing protein n=1 Tax=Albula goreensis TaxID=1534307 RepID=A0A8T3E582_9TELE|nr:hypothetical protein AGOR_G00038070 [Albula goreensis]
MSSKQERFKTKPSSQKFKTPPSSRGICNSPPSSQEKFKTPPSSQEKNEIPPSLQEKIKTPQSSQEKFKTPPSSQEKFKTLPSPQDTFKTPPSSQDKFKTPPSSQGKFDTPSSSQKKFKTPLSTQEKRNTPLLSQEIFEGPPSSQEKLETPSHDIKKSLPISPNFMYFPNSSSARRSVVRLEKPRTHYCVGDTLNVLVQMRNYVGLPKTYGGDFILARIHSPMLQASASGDVTDFHNGSYRVQFRLFWPGEVKVTVLLIHPSEAVWILQRDRAVDYGKTMHNGTFVNGSEKETTQCGLRLNTDRPLCEYRKKEDGEYFACHRPQTLPCSSLTTMVSYSSPRPLTMVESQLLSPQNTGIQIKNNFANVRVIGCTGAAGGPTEKCVAGMYSPFPSGHFFSNKWTSSFCQIAPFLAENDISRCLKGKTVYIMGDSTSRQWIEYLESHLTGLKFTTQADSYVSLLAVDAPNNITVHWKKHAHPWISYNVVNMKKTHFISEVLDSIEVDGEGEDVIVVIGIGQHFRPYPLQFFVSRLLSIRRAILRLQTRSPRPM